MSAWGESGDDGKYVVPVPFGEYRVDGYDLDPTRLHAMLAGKTDNPRNRWGTHRANAFPVAAGKPGRGVDLDYVDPVVITGPSGDVPASAPPVISWKPYPGAAAYRVQLSEVKRPGDFSSHRYVFEWQERPTVTQPSLDLSERRASLRKGFHYGVEIEALDASKSAISTSGNRTGATDFRIVE